MKIIDVQQNTSAWLQSRCGVVTASEFDNVISPEWKARTGQGVETFLLRKVAERCMGYPQQMFTGSGATEQGKLLEERAIPYYEFSHNVEIQRVGFCTSDDSKIGCSPDGLLGDEGGIEVKCPEHHTHVKYLLGGIVPKDYLAQIHGSMYVTGRKWWVFMSYSSFFPPLIIRVERNEIIQNAIHESLTRFVGELDASEIRLRAIIEQHNVPSRQSA